MDMIGCGWDTLVVQNDLDGNSEIFIHTVSPSKNKLLPLLHFPYRRHAGPASELLLWGGTGLALDLITL